MTATVPALTTQPCTVDGESLSAYRTLVRSPLGLPPATAGLASPVHPFLLSGESFDEVIDRLCPQPATVVHLSQEITSTRLVRPGETLSSRARVIAVRRDPRGLRLALGCSISTREEEVSSLVANVLLLGAPAADPWGDLPAPMASGGGATGAAETARVVLDRAFLRRYADLALDHNPIHLDDEAARAAGFDRVIAHGMSVLAVAAEAVVERFAGGEAARLQGIGARFSGPVHPDEPVDVELRPSASGEDVAFVCRTPRGPALKGGWARIADPFPPGTGRG